jgi:hypothetical protein
VPTGDDDVVGSRSSESASPFDSQADHRKGLELYLPFTRRLLNPIDSLREINRQIIGKYPGRNRIAPRHAVVATYDDALSFSQKAHASADLAANVISRVTTFINQVSHVDHG